MQNIIDYLISRVTTSYNQATRLVILTMIAEITHDYFDCGRHLVKLKKTVSSRLKTAGRAITAKNITRHELRKYRVMIDAYRDVMDIIEKEIADNGD